MFGRKDSFTQFSRYVTISIMFVSNDCMISLSEFVSPLNQSINESTCFGREFTIPEILLINCGIIMANSRITINTKTTTAPPVAILLAIFLHFFSFCTLGSKKCSKCFSKNFIIGLMRYAITNPKVIGCNTFIIVSQPFETPLYRYIMKKNIVQQQNSTNTSTARLMYQRIPCSVFSLFFLSSSIPFSLFFRNFISGCS